MAIDNSSRPSGLTSRTGALDVAGQARFLGQRINVPVWTTTADVAISASRKERSPEAMIARLPVIATSAGRAADWVLSEHTGLVAPPPDAAPLSVDIAALTAGRAHVAAQHSLDACVTAYADLYRRLADKVRSDP